MLFYITGGAEFSYIKGILSGWEKFIIKKAREEHGWKFDSVSDLARMFRAVGTTNFKSDDRQICEVICENPVRYMPSDFEAYRVEVDEIPRAADASDLDGEPGMQISFLNSVTT